MTKHIVHISTGAKTGCDLCNSFSIGGENFAASVNHYITDHGYNLLHVGSETNLIDINNTDALIIDTVAVLGK